MTELFKEPNTAAAVQLAIVSFALGAGVMCLVCKLLCRGKCNKKKVPMSAPMKRAQDSGRDDADAPAKRGGPPTDGSIEIYVGNLSYDLTEDRLRKEFEAFGKVNSARIITNRYNGKSKGYGFVHMPNESEVEAALAALSDKDLLGRKLRCNVAKNTL